MTSTCKTPTSRPGSGRARTRYQPDGTREELGKCVVVTEWSIAVPDVSMRRHIWDCWVVFGLRKTLIRCGPLGRGLPSGEMATSCCVQVGRLVGERTELLERWTTPLVTTDCRTQSHTCLAGEPLSMDWNLPLSSPLSQRAAFLRRRPAVSLQHIVGAGACEACRGRITKVGKAVADLARAT